VKVTAETVEATVELVRRTQAVHIDRRASRRLKKVNAAGEVVGEVESADLLSSLLDSEKIRHEELIAKEAAELKEAWAAVRERRKRGLPDLCHSCNQPLSMKKCSVLARDKRRVPVFTCVPCNGRLVGLELTRTMTSVEKARRSALGSAAASLVNSKRTKAERAASARKSAQARYESMTPAERQEQARKAGLKSGIVRAAKAGNRVQP
jgi:hypothetical protein